MKNANRPKPVVEPNLSRIVVAAASARFLAASGGRAGRSVSTIDLFADMDTVAICGQSDRYLLPNQSPNFAWQCRNMDEIIQRLEALVSAGDFNDPADPPVVLIGGGLENYFRNHPTSHKLADHTNVFASVKVKQWRHVSEFCRRNSVRFPPSSRELNARQVEQGWLVKTDFSSGGFGVQSAQAHTALEPDQFFQKYIKGRSISACYVAPPTVQGEEYAPVETLGACESISPLGLETHGMPFPFRYAGSTGPINLAGLASTTLIELKRVGSLVANHFGLTGIFGIDFILDGESLWLLEINPRITASAELIEYAARETMPEFSIVKLHLDALAGNADPKSPSIEACRNATACDRVFSKRIAYRHHDADQTLRVTQACIDALESQFGMFRGVGDLPPAAGATFVTDVPKPQTDVDAGQPILTLHASGESHLEVDQLMVHALDWLEILFGERLA